jgi:hypothetical protein
VEAAGIEPGNDIDASVEGHCECEECQLCRAAHALHFECFKSRYLTPFEIDLHSLISNWQTLPNNIRTAIKALTATSVR